MTVASGPASLVLARPVFDVLTFKTTQAQMIYNQVGKILITGALQSSSAVLRDEQLQRFNTAAASAKKAHLIWVGSASHITRRGLRYM